MLWILATIAWIMFWSIFGAAAHAEDKRRHLKEQKAFWLHLDPYSRYDRAIWAYILLGVFLGWLYCCNRILSNVITVFAILTHNSTVRLARYPLKVSNKIGQLREDWENQHAEVSPVLQPAVSDMVSAAYQSVLDADTTETKQAENKYPE